MTATTVAEFPFCGVRLGSKFLISIFNICRSGKQLQRMTVAIGAGMVMDVVVVGTVAVAMAMGADLALDEDGGHGCGGGHDRGRGCVRVNDHSRVRRCSRCCD